MASATITAQQFQALLNQAFSGIQGVGTDVISTITAQYAPRIAAIGRHAESVADETQDILTNAAADLADAGIQAEAVGAQLVLSGLALAINIAVQFATAAVVTG